MIVFFSGTGNTEIVARRLAELTGDRQLVALEGETLRVPESVVLRAEGDVVVWAFPTYSWGIPPVVVDFMRRVGMDSPTLGARHYMLTTCGDDMAYADRQWRKEMRRRGLDAAGAYAVVMPNTYVCMKGFDVDPKDVAERKLAAAPAAVKRIADAIMSGSREDILIRRGFSWVKSYVIYPWFVRFAMSAKPFWTTDACISCGKCAARCPMGNIVMENGRPRWGDGCALCLRCYHACGRHAVRYGKN